MIVFRCHSCQRSLKVKNALAGKRGRCRHCGTSIQVPAEPRPRKKSRPPKSSPPPAPASPATDLTVSPEEEALIVDPIEADAAGQAPLEANTLSLPGGSSTAKAGHASSSASSTKTSDGSADVVVAERLAVAGYQVLQELGRGGMGVVYKARQISLKRIVALKMILAGSHAGELQLQRFRTEAEAVAALQHPHIVQIYEIGEHDGCPFFSLEYIDGGSLEEALDGTPRSSRAAAQLVETLARAIQLAHDHDIVHRDLKPANVLLTTDGTPKITDFGLAKRLEDTSGMATEEGAVMGTPSYMAPEQALGKVGEIGPAVDIYALGAILYELLTGRPPFRAATSMDTLMQVVTDEVVPPSRLATRVPRDLETICLKCLRKDPRQRYPSAGDLAEDLHRFQEGEEIVARPLRSWQRALQWARKRPTMVALLLVSVVAGLALLGGTLGLLYNQQLQRAYDQLQEAQGRAEKERLLRETAVEEHQQEALQASASSLYFNQIALVDREWQANQALRAQRLIDACPAGQRRWEWYYLKRQCRPEQLALAHGGPVLAVAWSPDGRLATAAGDNRIRLWDATTGQRLLQLDGHSSWVRSLAFSPDGQRLASAGDDDTVRLWDLAPAGKGKELAMLTGHKGHVLCVAYSPDGRQLASAGADGTVRLWDPVKGKELAVLQGHTDTVTDLSFAPDEPILASCSRDRTIRLWDIFGHKELRQLRGHAREVTSLDWAPDGKQLATASRDGTVRLWDAATGQETGTLVGHIGPVRAVAYSPDGRRLASAGQSIKVWNIASGEELFTLRGHNRDITSLAFRADNQRLASGSEDGTARVWLCQEGPEARSLRGPKMGAAPSSLLAFSPDSRLVLTAEANNSLRLRDVVTGNEIQCLEGPDAAVTDAVFSPDGRWVVSRDESANVYLWDVESGEILWTKEELGRLPQLSPDGRLLALAVHRRVQGVRYQDIHLLNPLDGTLVRSIGSQVETASCLAFSPDGRRLAVGGDGSRVEIFDVATGTPRTSFQLPDQPIHDLAWSPDSEHLVCSLGHQNTQVLVLAVENRANRLRLGGQLGGHTGHVPCVAWSPDGSRIATGGKDSTIKLWNAATGQEILTLRGHREWVTQIAFSPDGHWLASLCKERGILLWDARPETAKRPR